MELKGGFDDVFNRMVFEETPTREECWLAQEDFWVKRELFYVVSNAMASQAYMYPVEIDEKEEPMPKDILYRHRYRNQNWEITLLIKLNAEKLPVVAGDSTIKNIQPNRHAQTLTSAKGAGIVFNVFQGNSTGTGLEVRGEPVPWNHVQKFSAEDYKEPLKGIDWSRAKEQPVGMSQAFDWPTCPIRRIEALAIGKQSCRTFTSPLQPNETLVKLDARQEDPNDPNKNPNGPRPRWWSVPVVAVPAVLAWRRWHTRRLAWALGRWDAREEGEAREPYLATRLRTTISNAIATCRRPRQAPARKNPAGICPWPSNSSWTRRIRPMSSWRWPTHACVFRLPRSSFIV